MKVLVAHYTDEWRMGHEDTKIFANTDAGTKAAIDWIDSNIPWEQGHMVKYFPNFKKHISPETKKVLFETLCLKGYVSTYDTNVRGERFPAVFDFSISAEEVFEG